MKGIVWKRPDGGVSITSIPDDADENVHIAKLRSKEPNIVTDPALLAAGVVAEVNYGAWQVVAVLPMDVINSADRYFRNAWTWTTPEPQIDVDMPRAREIHKNHLRRLRAPKLAALDIEYQRADEDGDNAKKAQIAAKKKALRDVTKDPAIAAAQTTEELKAVIPSALAG